MDTSFPCRISFFGSDQDYSIGSQTSIQSRCWGAFQDTDTFYILRIQIGDTISSISVSGICRSANRRISLFRRSVGHRYTVYYIKRLIISGYRTDSPKSDFGRTTHTGRILVDLHSCSFSGKGCYHIYLLYPIQFFPFYFLSRISQSRFILFKP